MVSLNMNRIIKLISPQKAFPEKTVCVTTYCIPITNSCSTVYDAVDSLRNKKNVYDQREKKQNHAEEIIEACEQSLKEINENPNKRHKQFRYDEQVIEKAIQRLKGNV